jgi:hypothetical protein
MLERDGKAGRLRSRAMIGKVEAVLDNGIDVSGSALAARQIFSLDQSDKRRARKRRLHRVDRMTAPSGPDIVTPARLNLVPQTHS